MKWGGDGRKVLIVLVRCVSLEAQLVLRYEKYLLQKEKNDVRTRMCDKIWGVDDGYGHARQPISHSWRVLLMTSSRKTALDRTL